MENLKIEDVCRRLEESTQRAEFKQVQLEGQLLQAQESIDKYKKDANQIMAEHMKRNSDLRQQD